MFYSLLLTSTFLRFIRNIYNVVMERNDRGIKDGFSGEGMMGGSYGREYILKCLLSLRWNFCKYLDFYIYMCCS